MAAENNDEPLSDWEGAKELNEEVRMTFSEPQEGTPAYDALMANRQHTVTQVDKHLKRHIKRVKKKHLIGSLKKEKRKDRANIKGKVIDGQHEQYILTMGMMMGIRVSVTRSQQNVSPLLVRDFGKVDKLVFPPGGSRRPGRLTPAHHLHHTFKFKDYAPRAFGALRSMFGVDPASYMTSVCGDFNFIQFIANSRSGQFFFYSHDGQYMIKTQTKQENKFLRRILPHYYRHMVDNPDSMICRFYGMHRVKMYHLRRKLHFVVMRSVVDTACKIHTMYDLKGSTKGRLASARDRETGGVLKDQDLLSDAMKFQLGEKRGPAFIGQLQSDAAFLSDLKIMDYSLLVGIHYRSRRDADEKKLQNGDDDEAVKDVSDVSAAAAAAASAGEGEPDASSTLPPPPPAPPTHLEGSSRGVDPIPPRARPPPISVSGSGGGSDVSSSISPKGGKKSPQARASLGGKSSKKQAPAAPAAATTSQRHAGAVGNGKAKSPPAAAPAPASATSASSAARVAPASSSASAAAETAMVAFPNGQAGGQQVPLQPQPSASPGSSSTARHSDTPLLRAKEKRHSAPWTSAMTAASSAQTGASGGEVAAGQAAAGQAGSGGAGLPSELTPTRSSRNASAELVRSSEDDGDDGDYDSDDDSSDSEEDDLDDLQSNAPSVGSVNWRRPFGTPNNADGDDGLGGSVSYGLPVKPLGELDDPVTVPLYNGSRASPLTSRRDGGMSSRQRVVTHSPSSSSQSSLPSRSSTVGGGSGGGGSVSGNSGSGGDGGGSGVTENGSGVGSGNGVGEAAAAAGGGGLDGSGAGSMVGGEQRGDVIYFAGIIDILQQYNSSKRAETFLKSFSSDVSKISCVPPDQYANRFVNFMKDATVAGEGGGDAGAATNDNEVQNVNKKPDGIMGAIASKTTATPVSAIAGK